MTGTKSILGFGAVLLFSATLIAGTGLAGTGTVAETMSSGGYVYLRLKEGDRWLAAAPTALQVGDRVRYRGGAQMVNFHSRTLGRNFTSIVFVADLEVLGATESGPHGSAHGGAASVAPPGAGEIQPIPGGMTVAEIHKGAARLANKRVTLRARVVKVSLNILGKNWVTLQDGTGSAPQDRLLATTTEQVQPGELVTVEGSVRANVELGSGYSYSLLLEEASFSR